jgi:hypothetical protein
VFSNMSTVEAVSEGVENSGRAFHWHFRDEGWLAGLFLNIAGTCGTARLRGTQELLLQGHVQMINKRFNCP